MSSLFRPHLELAAKVMDLQLERQNIISANLANQNTPRYKPRRIEYEQELQKAMGLDARGKMTKTSEGHMPSVFDAKGFQGDFGEEFKPRYVYGEDTVNMDKEVSLLTKNQLQYQTLATVMKKSYSGMSKIISEGQR